MPPDAEQTADQPSRDDLVEELVAECLERLPAEGEAVIESVCRDHPDFAADVLEHLRLLGEIGMVGPAAEQTGGAFPRHLGPFTLLRRLGGGGMGVVYDAKQDGLDRTVALKVIRPEHLYFPGARARFRREVDAVSKLQHPGIVPIYTLGVDNGVPYFAMERIEGASLADVLQERARIDRPLHQALGADFAEAVHAAVAAQASDAPAGDTPSTGPASADVILSGTWTETCLRVVRQVAYALDHAHTRGVIHRDVKPSNVMITKSGRAMLVDFGLARSEGSGDITRSGSTLGSLLYMSPEQLARRPVDHRIDIYSLGVTLYQMLTLEQPFLAQDGEVTRRNILEGRVKPVREINRQVPWEVETITRAAMEVDPARRYATAADFARDVENALARRPITARRPSIALRARRWVQRHPAQSVAIAAVALIAMLGPSLLYWQERDARIRIGRERAEAVKARNAATAASDLAKRRAREATEAERRAVARASTANKTSNFVIDLFAWARPQRWLGRDLSARKLADAGVKRLHMLDDEPTVQAPLLAMFGHLYLNLGEQRIAERLLRRAAAGAGAEGVHDGIRASIERGLGVVAGEYGRFAEAEERLERALTYLENATDLRPASVEHRKAEIQLALAATLQLRGDLAEAERITRTALAQFEGESDDAKALSATTRLSSLLNESGRSAEAERVMVSALRASSLPSPHPLRANAICAIANAICHGDELLRAVRLYRQSLAMWSTLELGEHRAAAAARYGLGSVLARIVSIGVPLRNAARDAEEAFREAIRVFENQTSEAFPTHDGLGVDNGLWISRVALGCLLVDLKRYDEATPYLVDLDREHHGRARYHRGRALVALAKCKVHAGDRAGGIETATRGLAELTHYYSEDSIYLAPSLEFLGKWQFDAGAHEDATRTYRRVVAAYERHNGPDDGRLASPHVSLGLLAETRGDLAKAEAHFRAAERIADRRRPGRQIDAIAKLRLGALLSSQERFLEAEPFLRLGFAVVAKSVGPNRRAAYPARHAVALHYRRAGNPAEAERFLPPGPMLPTSPLDGYDMLRSRPTRQAGPGGHAHPDAGPGR